MCQAGVSAYNLSNCIYTHTARCHLHLKRAVICIRTCNLKLCRWALNKRQIESKQAKDTYADKACVMLQPSSSGTSSSFSSTCSSSRAGA